MIYGNEKDIIVLAGDIGGTKTDLALYSSQKGLRSPLVKENFPSKEYTGLEDIVKKFLSRHHIQIDRAGFGVAGPVVNGQAEITNLPWVMDETILAQRLHFKSVCLLNDVTAFANAVPFLTEKDLHRIKKGDSVPRGAMAVVSPGTGLGEAFLVWDGSAYRAFPSEGGHADFAPTNPMEADLLGYLATRFDHVSYERVCSGIGMANIHAYFQKAGHDGNPCCSAELLSAAEDPVPHIIRNALDSKQPCSLCRKTLSAFVSILGAEAGNMALKTMATGGVYLGGGIPPRILQVLENDVFLTSFIRKGRMSDLMKKIPVYVIVYPDAALLGAAHHAMTTNAFRNAAGEKGK